MKIVFMGTPDFAVPSLDILVKNGYDIAAVITATDKMGGRGGKQILQSAVKKYAVEQNLRVLQPEKLKNPEFIDILRGINADLFIVVAFRMLPEIVWTMPPLGTFNLHGSLLPKYRGAAPLNWAVINGEKETGVTTFFLKHEIDTGDIIFRESLSIGDDESVGEVHDRMMTLGADTVLKTVQAIDNQNIKVLPQLDTAATHAPKIFQETCEIDFNKTTAEVHNFVRGLSPFPTAWTTLDGLKLKIFKTQKEENLENIPPQYKSDFEGILTGKFVSDNKNYLKITTADGLIQLLDVQLEGRKRMTIKDFLNGYRLNGNTD
jgi:methionyl-tRNA formyltransferase